MKILLPLTQILPASSLGQGRGSQLPLKPRNERLRSSNHHPIFVGGDSTNWYHSTTFSVGTPPQTFNAILDLGSSDLIIPSAYLASPRGAPPFHKYNSSISTTYIPNGTLINSTFLWDTTTGFLSQDDFQIGHLIIKDSLFQEATSMNFRDCLFCEFDAVFPLGSYNKRALRNFMSPIAQLISRNLLDENVFSLRLSRGTTDTPGQLLLGGVLDESLHDGEFTTIPMTDRTARHATDKNWKAEAESLTLGDGSQIQHIFESPTVALLDVAYPWIGLPYHLVHDITALMDAEEWGPFAWVDCSRRAEFPGLTIVLAGENFVLSPYDYLLESEYYDEPGKLYCQSAFMPLPREFDGVIMLGSAFLKAFVTVWDFEGRNVSFATAKHGPPRNERALLD